MRDGSDQDQALCVARRRHYQYREVIDVLAGIIFLGFPHVELNQVDQMDILSRILCSRPKIRVKIRLEKRDQEDFQTLCQQFEMAKLQVPILSAYETKETKMNRSMLGCWRNQAHILRAV